MEDKARVPSRPPGKPARTPVRAPVRAAAKLPIHPLPVRSQASLFFFAAYRGTPPWDIGRPQPAFVELANADLVHGRVLDAGCGTGENALEMADRGFESWGLDIVPTAIQKARAKAKQRGLPATFLVHDALELPQLRRRFDTVIDSGLFHVFTDAERETYEAGLRRILNPGGFLHVLCLSDWEDPSWGGPRRVSQAELLQTFSRGWRVDDIRRARFVSNFPQVKGHSWLATFVREP